MRTRPPDRRGTGEPIVLLHAFPLDGRLWEHQVAGLQRSFQVIVPDLGGFGTARLRDDLPAGSALVPDPDWVDRVADGIVALLDRLGLPAATVVGLSMGGYVALALLRRHPDRLRALALLDTRSDADSPDVTAGRLDMAARVLADGVDPFLADVMLPRLLGVTTRASRPDVVEHVRRILLDQDPAAVADAQCGMAGRPDATGLLGEVRVPTLVLCGAEDTVSRPAQMRQLAAAVPGARWELVDGAGHLTALERPEVVTDLLDRFVSEAVAVRDTGTSDGGLS